MIARTAIPITRYRILTKQQAAPTARCVAKGSPGVADPRDRDVANAITGRRVGGR